MKCRFDHMHSVHHACGIPDGYIIEKILSCRKTHLCFEGNLCITGLSCLLSPPLHLQQLEVIDVVQQHTSACCRPESTVRIQLRCQVCDCFGKQACGTASIVLSAPKTPCLPSRSSLRLGAHIELLHACFFRDSSFYIRADVCLAEVVSGCPALYPREKCCGSHLNKPLYPMPACRTNEGYTNIYKTLHEEYS